jgi:hypothetical protein
MTSLKIAFITITKMRPQTMNEIIPNGHHGLLYIGVAILGKIVNLLTLSTTMQYLSTAVTLIGGLLAATHYCVLLYDRFVKKPKS